MTNKEASSKQEKMVANYMGWQVVTGSGSRPFRPGDVQNDHFLVECKTHTEMQDKIVFYLKHWTKISEEAQAKHRYPALIVDDGTQKSQNTWVMIPRHVLPGNQNTIFALDDTSRSGNTITFNHATHSSLYNQHHVDSVINYFISDFGDDLTAIMPLEEFRTFYTEQFES